MKTKLCTYFIDSVSFFFSAQVPNKTILLEFDELNTECSYDFLFIYDGNSYQDRMLASFSGNNIPDPIMAQSGQVCLLVCHTYLIFSSLEDMSYCDSSMPICCLLSVNINIAL